MVNFPPSNVFLSFLKDLRNFTEVSSANIEQVFESTMVEFLVPFLDSKYIVFGEFYELVQWIVINLCVTDNQANIQRLLNLNIF